ncbi:MAG: GTPase [Oscillospiraceae bacterium]
MAGLNVNRAEFVKSAASPAQFIRSSMPSVVFAGKSNVGKSSVINRLLNRKNSPGWSSPGKTVHVNYFCMETACTLWTCRATAMPRFPSRERERWGKLMEILCPGG